ncbi:MAG: ATP-binding protein [Gemmatimonadales bacterium]|nr:ATP-binding protein [Gemmatimonadales bacterium]
MSVRLRVLLGFALMLVPVLLLGAVALRANSAERAALEQLGEGLARTRTFAELEAALQAQAEVVWRGLSGRDAGARREHALAREVTAAREAAWRAVLRPDEQPLATRLDRARGALDAAADTMFAMMARGDTAAAWRVAQGEFRTLVLPLLQLTSREIYAQLRQTSVRGAFTRLEQILASERRALVLIVVLALGLGVAASWRIARDVASPLAQLADAMRLVGEGQLDAPLPPAGDDEVGRLAAAFGRMRDNLRAALGRAVQAERLASIGQMAASVAHGLRNPLAGVRASAQAAMALPPGSAAFREMLDGMVAEVDRLDRRITHLLSFSRPAPHRPLRDRPAALVEGALSALGEGLRARGIALETTLDPALPEVLVDPMQLEQVLVELVSNAMQAMPAGGTIGVHARPEGDEVVLEVADDGEGIPADVLPQVTELFFTTRADGTGLGLAIARRFTEQNGGRLEIESAPGAGTRARIRLPAAAAPAGAAA